jgi:hypothetical protein
MIINFRTCRISRDTHKLTRTLTLKKKFKKNENSDNGQGT